MRYWVGGMAALLAFLPGCMHRPPPAAPPLPAYRVQDLGTLGSENSYVSSINNRGQLVGLRGPRLGKSQPFLWTGGKTTQIAPLGGRSADAAQINDSGQIVGTLDPHDSDTEDGDEFAFLWQKGHLTKLDTLTVRASGAAAINSQGDIIGQAEFGPHRSSGFLWQQGKVAEVMPSSGSGSYVRAINDAGQIVGLCGNNAVVWMSGPRTPTVIGTGDARAINNRGQVAGGNGGNAFLWQNGHLTLLNGLNRGGNSFAFGINDAGQIIGLSSPPKTTPPQKYNRAVLWQNGYVYDLNSVLPPQSNLLLTVATAINNRGQIVCDAIKDGKSHVVILTPTH